MKIRFTPELKEKFLELIEETPSVQRAAEIIGVPRRTIYHHKKTDPAFAREWDTVIDNA